MYLSPSTPTAAQPLPQINGEQSQAGPSRPQQQQQHQGQWQPPSTYSPMMQPQQPGAYYPANGGPSGWAGGNRMPQPPRYHDYPVQQQQGMPQGYYPPGTGYYPSYQQRPQHPQQSHPTPQSMSHLHYHPIQPQYPMPPAQPQPQPPPAPAEPAPTPTPPPTSSTPLNPAAQGFTFVPRSSIKPQPAPAADPGPVYASVAHPPSYNPSPIPPHVAMMYPGYGMPMMMGMNPYQQMNPYQYPMPQHYQQPQQHQQPMLSPVTAQMPPPPDVVIPVSAGVRISTPPVKEAASSAVEDRAENKQEEERPQEEQPETKAEVETEEKVEEPVLVPESTEIKPEEAKEQPKEVQQQSPISKPSTPQLPAAPYTYLSHPSPSSYAYLVSAQRPADPTSAPAMSFGTRTTMPKRVKEQATTWKGEIASTPSLPKRKPGVGMVFGVGIGKEDQRKVELVFGSVSASEPVPPTEVEHEVKPETTSGAFAQAKKQAAVESKGAPEEAKTVPTTPSAVPPPAPSVAPVSPTPSGTATPTLATDDKPKANGVEQPKAAPVKPSSWAALVRNKASASVPATSPSSSSKPASPGPEAVLEPEAGPSKPNGATSTPPAGPAPVAPRPAFNYAAAAASGSTTKTPAEEFARLLSEGIYPDQGGKGKGRERTVTVPRGLINMGNMCFANSILQVLVFCTPFAQLFEELGKRLKADLARRTPLVEAMIIFLREFTVSPASAPNGGSAKPLSAQNMDAFLPSNVYDAMKLNKRFDSLRRGHQEDAEEFLGFFLNTLHEELLLLHARMSPTSANGTKAAPKPTENSEQEEREIERPVSPGADGGDGWLEVGKKQKTNVVRTTESRESAVSRIFGGKLRSVLHTPGQKDSVTLEPYQSLQLDVQHPNVWTITDALRHLNEAEIVPDVWSASRNANVEATKQVFMETMPACLILHVKRFGFEYKEQRAYKHSKPLGYGTELVIPPEIISPGRRATQPTKYKLFGIIYHHGPSMSGGHYTAAVARQDGSGWLHLDDESIEPIPTEQVVVSREAAMEGKAGEVGRAGREKCAYLAFYQRV